MRREVLLLACFLLPACAPQDAGTAAPVEAASPAVHPQSGLQVVPLTIQAGGRTHRFRVEVADTPATQARGLMFRTQMGADEGMIFPYDTPQQLAFWMRNTVLPLDLIFVGPDHKVLNVISNAVPYSEENLPSAGPAIAVLELNGGRAAELGIDAGATVQW